MPSNLSSVKYFICSVQIWIMTIPLLVPISPHLHLNTSTPHLTSPHLHLTTSTPQHSKINHSRPTTTTSTRRHLNLLVLLCCCLENLQSHVYTQIRVLQDVLKHCIPRPHHRHGDNHQEYTQHIIQPLPASHPKAAITWRNDVTTRVMVQQNGELEHQSRGMSMLGIGQAWGDFQMLTIIIILLHSTWSLNLPTALSAFCQWVSPSHFRKAFARRRRVRACLMPDTSLRLRPIS